MIGAILRGITMKDMDNLTIGQIVDYCIEYNNMNNKVESDEYENIYDSDKVIIADQRYFDSF